MLNGNKLEILDFIRINENLPKWKEKKVTNQSTKSWNISNNDNFAVVGGTTISMNDNDVVTEFQRNSINYLDYLKRELQSKDNISIYDKWKYNIVFFLATIFLQNKKKEIITKKTYTIENFFKTLKDSKMEITKTQDILDKYEAILKGARDNGQQALVEKLLKMKDVITSEARLIENGITKYVTEEQVVKLYKETEKNKNLKLTYIDNYIRIIPSDIIKLKDKADEIMVFDNYVILHFDPLDNAVDLTEKQKENKAKEEARKKDPILFGVFSGSRKLYFIGDWIDEYCDLTLSKMMEIISDKELEITNESVSSYIENAYKS